MVEQSGQCARALTVHDLSLPYDSFTYLSPSHNTTRWLDHIVSNNCFSLQNISIDFNAVSFDHFTVSGDFIIDGNINYFRTRDELIDEFVDRHKFDRDAIEMYNFQCENNLQNVDMCDVLGCNQLEHCQKIDDALEIILQTFKSATQDYRHKKVKKFVPVPGWNEHCKDLHEKARQAFVAWRISGKLRCGQLYNEMKTTRKNFTSGLKYCKRNEQKIKETLVAESFVIKMCLNFGKKSTVELN